MYKNEGNVINETLHSAINRIESLFDQFPPIRFWLVAVLMLLALANAIAFLTVTLFAVTGASHILDTMPAEELMDLWWVFDTLRYSILLLKWEGFFWMLGALIAALAWVFQNKEIGKPRLKNQDCSTQLCGFIGFLSIIGTIFAVGIWDLTRQTALTTVYGYALLIMGGILTVLVFYLESKETV